MLRLTRLKETVSTWRELESNGTDLLELVELALISDDQSLVAQLTSETMEHIRIFEEQEFQLTLTGPHDHRPAILTVYAGAGGVDSQDWSGMLIRMYLRWAERQGYRTKLLNTSHGEEAGIKSGTIEV